MQKSLLNERYVKYTAWFGLSNHYLIILKRRVSLLDNESVKIGNILKRLRKSKLLSQEEFAFRSGVDRRYISDLERDIYKPGLLTFINMARALEMKPSELMKEFEDCIDILKDLDQTDYDE